VDSDFDVDESTWGPEDDSEEKLQREMKAQMKKKSWIKPYKDPLVREREEACGVENRLLCRR